jgi:O-antigen/teichoic acid export membrane protein
MTNTHIPPQREFGSDLASDPLIQDLAGRSARGGVITASAQAVKFVLQTASTMVLARLLTPADFGLVAMVVVFTSLIGLFRDLGLSMATVQRAEITHRQVSTLFWINVVASLVLTAICIGLAPFVARFYGQPELVWIMVAIAGTYVFGGLSAQHTALLRRQMRFRALAAIDVGAMAVGIALSILVAWFGGGYWALVAMIAGQAIATTVLCFICSGWRPGWWHFDAAVVEMLWFGANLTGSSLVHFFSRNTDNLLIGRFWGAIELGIYSRAYALLLLPLQQINRPLAAVVIPVLSRLQGHPEQFRRYYLRVVQIIAYVSMPLVVLLAVLAEEVVAVVLGDQWLDAAVLFQIFAALVFIQNVAATTGWLLASLGRGGRLFRWGMFDATVLISAFIIGLPWGAVGVAAAGTIAALVTTVPSMLVAYHDTPISVRDVARAVSRPVLVAGLLFLVVWNVRTLAADTALVPRVLLVLGAATLFGLLTIACSRTVRDDVRVIGSVLKR